MKTPLLAACLAAATLAASNLDSPSGNRTTPPTLNSVSPLGVARGTTTQMEVEGLNLAGASKIYFSQPGVTGRILHVKELPDLPDVRLGSNGTLSTVDLGPLPPRNQVTVEITTEPGAAIGPVRFRLLTPLGTTPAGRFLVEPYYGESPDKEPNDTPEQAVETDLPAILSGAVSRPGDVDYYRIHAAAGERLVFFNQAALIGSTLQPVIGILSEDQTVLKEFGADGGMDAQQFAYRFDQAGVYYVRVADFAQTGRASNFYRILIGKFPLVSWAYPNGVEQGKSREVSLYGFNLKTDKITVEGKPSEGYVDSFLLRPKGAGGVSFNELRLAVGAEPEVESSGKNLTCESAQAVTLPVTIDGAVAAHAEHYFRFHARKGEKVIAEVNARRLGSPLDSEVEILDASGNRIQRAEARSVLQTTTTLSERDSSSSGIRLTSWTGMNVGDYIMIGNEIIRLKVLQKGPDEDARFEALDGQRISYFDTSTEDHSIDKPVYKVLIYPPGEKFSPNGLPLVPLYYRNDDGGPGYGKDSLVHFTAPADGDYLVRIGDVGGDGGPEYTYRLSVHAPRPDFRLSFSPENPNVPAGGSVPVTVEAKRIDGFDGPIAIKVDDLPSGLRATSAVIEPGQFTTTLLLSAEPSAKLAASAPLRISGAASGIWRRANMDDPLALVSLMPPSDVQVTAHVKEIDLAPGGRAQIPVSVVRANGFRGRVPLEVLNLPPRVEVPNVGLNGVLINENETERTITVEALPSAAPGEQTIYVAARTETRSSLPTDYAAPQAIVLKIGAGKTVAAR